VRWIPCSTLLLTLLLAGCYSGTRPARIGEAAPDFTVTDSDRMVALHDFRGKVVVLKFLGDVVSTLCGRIAIVGRTPGKIENRGIQVVAVSVDVDGNAYRRFLRDQKVDLLTVRDPDHKSDNLYGTFKYPETYIIDRDGKLRRKFVGPVDWGTPEVVDFLQKL